VLTSARVCVHRIVILAVRISTHMNVTRADVNPLIVPADVPPSSHEMTVIGAFNPAAVRVGEETLLLLRVAEAVRDVAPDEVAVPMVNCQAMASTSLHVERIARNTPGVDLTDRRLVRFPDQMFLTSLSHLRLARSRDGIHFTVDATPALFPAMPYEEYGIEDPRITHIDGVYYITYTAVSRWGITVGLASTTDFRRFTRHGLIFGPENKDVVLFPARIDGRFYALHRPSFPGLGELQVWLASSPDIQNWGGHRPLLARRHGAWDALRIGAGDVPVLTSEGWLLIYHGVSREYGYSLGAALLDARNPARVLARSTTPLMIPRASYECTGFFDNAVFTCGSILDNQDRLRLYYGAADAVTCTAWIDLDDIFASLYPAPASNFSLRAAS
jgi:predicted GH43/DUF377 family glycosyl hydrolase